MKTDLHIHTWASDGTWSPEMLLEKVKQAEINVFSVTDHDEIESSERIKELVQNDKLVFIPGVEVSCTFRDREYHLTAYHYKQTPDFLRLIDWNKETRLKYNDAFIKMIAKEDSRVSIEDYHEQYQNDTRRGGWKALNYLLDKNIYSSKGDYFKALNISGLTLVFKEAEEVISRLKASGAYVFLAHPSYYYPGEAMSVMELKNWKGLGIDGIECITPYGLDKQQIDFYKAFCKKHQLMISGGSDCHGDFLSRPLGYPQITIDDLEIHPLLNERESFSQLASRR